MSKFHPIPSESKVVVMPVFRHFSPASATILQEILDLAAEAFLKEGAMPSLNPYGNYAYMSGDGSCCAIGLYLRKHMSNSDFNRLASSRNSVSIHAVVSAMPEVAKVFRPITEELHPESIFNQVRPISYMQIELHDGMIGDEGWLPQFQSLEARVERYRLCAEALHLEFDASKYLPAV